MTEQLYSYIPITDEMLVDFGLGNAEEQAAAAARIAERQAQSHAAWMERPRWEHAWLGTVRPRLTAAHNRLSLAVEALRGKHECGYE